MTINLTFSQLIPELSKTRKVIAVELQGHGHTADIDRAFSFESMADDVAACLKLLKIDHADVLGYSMGGAVALQLVIRHPEIVRKLILISTAFKSDGWYPEATALFPKITPEMFQGTPIKKAYDSVAPDPSHWAIFVNKLKVLNASSYDWTSNISSIKAPMFIIIGDADGVRLEHAIEFFKMKGGGHMGDLAGLPDSRFAIFPASSHVGVMMHPDWLISMLPPFLDLPLRSNN